MTDRVPQARIYRVWNVAAVRHRRTPTACSCSRRCSAAAQSSRLDKRLVHEDKIVDSVSACAWTQPSWAASSSSGRRQGGRRPGQGREGDRRGAAAPDREGPTADGARRRPRPCSAPASSAASSASAASAARPTCWPSAPSTPATRAASATSSAASTSATPAQRQGRRRRSGCAPGDHTLVISPASARRSVEEPAVATAADHGAGRRPEVQDRRQRRRPQHGRADAPTSFPDAEVPGAAARHAVATASRWSWPSATTCRWCR